MGSDLGDTAPHRHRRRCQQDTPKYWPWWCCISAVFARLAPRRPSASHSSAGENWKWKRQPALSRRRIFFFTTSKFHLANPRPGTACLGLAFAHPTDCRQSGPTIDSSRRPLGHRLFPARSPPRWLVPFLRLIPSSIALSNRNHAYVTESASAASSGAPR